MTITASCALALTFFPNVAVDSSFLRLGDVADLSALPADLARRAADTPLLRVVKDSLRTAVPRGTLVAQIGARFPALAGCFGNGSPETIAIHRRASSEIPEATGTRAGNIMHGMRVTLRVKSGPFTIERTGIAAGAASAGERLFVRTKDRQVVRAVVAGAPQ